MTRRRSRNAKSAPPPQIFEWRNHPVIVASGSAAATFLLCLAIFTQLVEPTQNAKLEIELLKMKDANQQLTNSINSANQLNNSLVAGNSRKDKELFALKGKVSLLQQELIDAKAENLFAPGNPYPSGLGLVRIGMNRSDIAKAYQGFKIESDPDGPSIVTVYLVNSPFERVSYHLSDKTESAKITHLSFDMPLFQSKYSKDFLYKKLVESFGVPSKNSTNSDFMWPVGNTYSLFSHGKDNYVLMRRGDVPVFWALR